MARRRDGESMHLPANSAPYLLDANYFSRTWLHAVQVRGLGAARGDCGKAKIYLSAKNLQSDSTAPSD